MRGLGFALIVLGIVLMLINGFNIPVKRNVVKIGTIELSKVENKWVGWPVYAGGVMAVLGAVLVIAGHRRIE